MSRSRVGECLGKTLPACRLSQLKCPRHQIHRFVGRALLQFERRYGLRQLSCARGQLVCLLHRTLHHLGVALRELVKLPDRRRNLGEASALLGTGGGDERHVGGHTPHTR
jgi:hypothetical protein